jgi:hypothetical protein
MISRTDHVGYICGYLLNFVHELITDAALFEITTKFDEKLTPSLKATWSASISKSRNHWTLMKFDCVGILTVGEITNV